MLRIYFTTLIISIVLVFHPNRSTFAQNSKKFGTLDIGFNMGMYIPNKYNAHFYDGSESNVNKLSFILGNKYQYEAIKNALNCTDTFFLSELPTNMRYNVAFNIGLYLRKTFDNYTGVNIQILYSKLTAQDVFSIEIDPNAVILTNKNIGLYNIWGIEERYNIDISFSKYFKQHNKHFMPFFDAGININNTKVKENKIKIEGLEYSLINTYLNGSYVPGTQVNEYDIRQGGLGWGACVTGGYRIQYDKIIIYPGFTFYMQKINLENYSAVKPSFELFVKLSLSEVLFGDAPLQDEKFVE